MTQTSDRDGENPRYEHIRFVRSDDVVTITLDRPRVKNAMPMQGWAELRDAFRAVRPGLDRVLVLTGAGTDFCAGADLGGPATGDHHLVDMKIITDMCIALYRLPIPTIARVDGVAVGAGMNLALACDFVLASSRSRFSEIFVNRALSVDCGGSWLLPRLIGTHRAKELVLLGDIIDAQQAQDIGLVRSVVEQQNLDKTVDELVTRLANGPALAISQSKLLLNNAFDVTLEHALDDEARAQTVNNTSDDAAEALAAFKGKRPNNFRKNRIQEIA
ncbi:enoyl-CoA hydratase/isomerase family protein [Rhodococcoides fascians]|uniref:enoyl-CoA hydratase/isomerase family protein n=1 Tax=Rhodococcoides fascians TaxID=1828 RepID=UPI0009B8427F|nr:enoyl-CoA hydratase-related protein [Rhodococcus fascians]